MEENKIRLFKDFETEFEKPSKSTFHNYLNKMAVFKKPIRLTDLCRYCERFNEIRTNLPARLRGLNYEFFNAESIDVKKISNFLDQKAKTPKISIQELNQVIILFFIFQILFKNAKFLYQKIFFYLKSYT